MRELASVMILLIIVNVTDGDEVPGPLPVYETAAEQMTKAETSGHVMYVANGELDLLDIEQFHAPGVLTFNVDAIKKFEDGMLLSMSNSTITGFEDFDSSLDVPSTLSNLTESLGFPLSVGLVTHARLLHLLVMTWSIGEDNDRTQLILHVVQQPVSVSPDDPVVPILSGPSNISEWLEWRHSMGSNQSAEQQPVSITPVNLPLTLPGQFSSEFGLSAKDLLQLDPHGDVLLIPFESNLNDVAQEYSLRELTDKAGTYCPGWVANGYCQWWWNGHQIGSYWCLNSCCYQCGEGIKVLSGQTLTEIAAWCGHSIELVAAENNIVKRDQIWVGQMLRMPNCAPAGYGTSGGLCGPNNWGFTCPPSQCCSGWGMCGASLDHCNRARGCNDQYGICFTPGTPFQQSAGQCSPTSWDQSSLYSASTGSLSMSIQAAADCCYICTQAVKVGGTCWRAQSHGISRYWLYITLPSQNYVCDPWSF